MPAAELDGAAPTLRHKGPAQAPADAAATGMKAGVSCGAVTAQSQQAGMAQVLDSAQSGSCTVARGQTCRRQAAIPAPGSSPASAAETLSPAFASWDQQPHRQLPDGSAAALEERPQQQLPHSSVEGPAALWSRSGQDGQPDAAAAVTLQGQAADRLTDLLRQSSSSRCDSDKSWGDAPDDDVEALDELEAAFEAEGDAGKGSCDEGSGRGKLSLMLLVAWELHLSRKPTLGVPPTRSMPRASQLHGVVGGMLVGC